MGKLVQFLVLGVGLSAGSLAQLTVQENLRLREDDFAPLAFDAGNLFGSALATCDFDNDGFEDLAIGSPGADTSVFVTDAGMVHVAYGSADGLTLDGHQTLTQPVGGADPPENGDFLGWGLAAGRFDGDGFCDLAVGAPGETVDGESAAGSVHVFYGSASGLETDSQVWSQNTPGIEETAEADDVFGLVLAAGDFDDDGFDDLAVAAPWENGFGGVVHILFGTSAGLSAADDDLIFQGDPEGTSGIQEGGDTFGAALAVGYLDDDTHADLAIGVPSQDFSEDVENVGWLHVLHGESTGFETRDEEDFHQSDLGGGIEEGDRFGASLSTGDFDGDGNDDLAVGSPGDNLGFGAVSVAFGGPAGVSGPGSTFWRQGTPGVSDQMEFDDHFGDAVAAGDFDGDGYDDLGVGVPGEDFEGGGHVDNGALHALYGTVVGIAAVREQYHGQGGWNLGAVEDEDGFGQVLATGDFDGDGIDALVVGIPGEGVSGESDAGLVGVITGVFRDPAVFADGFEDGDTSAWESVVD